MSTGVGPVVQLAPMDPCMNSPNVSSVGTPSLSGVGTCGPPEVKLTIDIDLTLTGSLAGSTVGYRAVFQTGSAGTPSGGWTTWSGFTGTSDTLTWSPPGTVKIVNSPGTTYYFTIEFAVIGTDGTTVCDTGTSSDLQVDNVDDCAA